MHFECSNPLHDRTNAINLLKSRERKTAQYRKHPSPSSVTSCGAKICRCFVRQIKPWKPRRITFIWHAKTAELIDFISVTNTEQHYGSTLECSLWKLKRFFSFCVDSIVTYVQGTEIKNCCWAQEVVDMICEQKWKCESHNQVTVWSCKTHKRSAADLPSGLAEK